MSSTDHFTEWSPQIVTILESISDAFFAIDCQWNFIYINQKAAMYFPGTTRQELIGKNIWQVYPMLEENSAAQKYREAASTGQAVHFEDFYTTTQVWIEHHVYPSENGLFIYFQNITAHKQVEQQVRYLTSLADNIPDAIIATDTNHAIQSWNTAAEKLYGWSKEEVLNKPIFDVIPTINTGTSPAEFRSKISTEQSWHGDVIQYNKNGQRLFITTSIATFTDETEEVSGLVSLNRDVTEQKQIEEERDHLLKQVSAEHAQLETVLQQIPSGVIIAEAPTGRFILGNKQVEQIWRHPFLGAAKISQYENYKGFHTNGRPYLAEEWPLARAIVQGETITNEEINFLRGDGTSGTMSVSAAPIIDEYGTIIAGAVAFHDITEQKQNVQRKDIFISMASHELKTPLTSLKAFTQLLQKRLINEGRDDIVKNLRSMETQISRLTKLIVDLLDISRMQAGELNYKKVVFDFNEMLQEVISTLQPINPNHALTLEGPTHLQYNGDRERLGQVFANLINNAVKYSVQADKVDIQVSTTAERLIVSIRDYGIGISREDQHRIFERFYRAYNNRDKTYPGLGIGLYISFEIIKYHGGDIWVESVEGQGSTFYVALPINNR